VTGREAPAWLAGGRIGRPHGLDGSFHVTRPRAALLALGATVQVAGTRTEIVRRAGTAERPILRLAAVEGREAAEALRGEELLVPRDAAPPLGEDEWWAEDLEGCRVVDGERELGRVRRLVPLPSCEALEVAAGGDAFLVPLVRDAVRSVDVSAGVIDIDAAFLGDTAPAAVAATGGQAAGESERRGSRVRDAADDRGAGLPAEGPGSARRDRAPAAATPARKAKR
jgi:16S rRNA processing protein RimM